MMIKRRRRWWRRRGRRWMTFAIWMSVSHVPNCL